jgi:hypothetical protein
VGEQLASGFEHRNASLRRKQFEAAMNGNTTILIWLGKQYLGQRDKREMSGPDGVPSSISVRFVDPVIERLLAGGRGGPGERARKTSLIQVDGCTPSGLDTMPRLML